MARLILFAPCQVVLADATFGGVSLINIIESLGVPKFPAALPIMALVAMWRRNEDELDSAMIQRVVLISPSDALLATVDTPFLFDKMGHRIMNHIGNVPLPEPGKYEFRVYVTRQGAQFPEQPSGVFPVLIVQMPTQMVISQQH